MSHRCYKYSLSNHYFIYFFNFATFYQANESLNRFYSEFVSENKSETACNCSFSYS